jgi:hypothetical protein
MMLTAALQIATIIRNSLELNSILLSLNYNYVSRHILRNSWYSMSAQANSETFLE